MMAFSELSDMCRSLFALWTLLLCCAGIAGMVLSLAGKRARYVWPSIVIFIPSYFFWQVTFSLRRFGRMEKSSNISIRFVRLPWPFWALALVLLTSLAIFVIARSVRYIRTTITPLSIKYCADKMPCGICYWRDNGHVIFSNDCMNRLCIALSGKPLMNGNRFHEALPEGIHQSPEKTWSFAYRELLLDGERLHEMIAMDVTEIHQRTEALRRDNEALARLNEELKAYGFKIEDTIRRQEILQAKRNIHDEMNRLMLTTMAADCADRAQLDRLFAQWEQNALLLCTEADGDRKNAKEQINRLAQTLGLCLQWRADPPRKLSDCRRELVFIAAQEAVTNAVKHAGAKSMEIFFEEKDDCILCNFENNGSLPENEVHFTGGLANLARLAAEQNASVSVKIGKTFALVLRFVKNR